MELAMGFQPASALYNYMGAISSEQIDDIRP